MFLLDLAPGGGCLAAALLQTPVVSYTAISPLPSEQVSPGEKLAIRRYISVARSDRFPRPGCYPAPCSQECGLSSTQPGAAARSPGQPGQIHHTRIKLIRQSLEGSSASHRRDEFQGIPVSYPGFQACRQSGNVNAIQKSVHMRMQRILLVQPVWPQDRHGFEEMHDRFLDRCLLRQQECEFFLPCDQLEGCIQFNFDGDGHGGIKP